MKTKEDIFNEIAKLVNELFDIPLENISQESRFYEDLDLDSIDAIDLIGSFQEQLNERINPEDFKSVRTIGDVVNVAYTIVSK